jgi:predicted transposase YdaD
VKTDSIFYRLFQEFPSILFELIDHPPETANLYQFSSIEVNQTAFRIDGVFLPIKNRAPIKQFNRCAGDFWFIGESF